MKEFKVEDMTGYENDLSHYVKTAAGQFVAIDTANTFDCGWETMVFKCNENRRIVDWTDLDVRRYSNEQEARIGHKKMCEKWEKEVHLV